MSGHSGTTRAYQRMEYMLLRFVYDRNPFQPRADAILSFFFAAAVNAFGLGLCLHLVYFLSLQWVNSILPGTSFQSPSALDLLGVPRRELS